MKTAYSADWHSDNMKKTYLINGIPNREIDLDKQVQLMVEKCVERNVEWFFILGDLFDKHVVSAYYFNKVVDYLREFTKNKIRVVVIPGNHETKESGIPLTNALMKLSDHHISVYDEITELSKLGIILIPHIRRDEYKDFKSYTEYIKNKVSKYEISRPIIAGHFQPTTVTPGSEQEMFSGSTRFLNCSIFKNALIVCGHVHKPQEQNRVIVPGSPVRFSLAERTEQKRFVVYDTETQELESVDLDCQKMSLIKIDLFSKNTLSLPDDKIRKYKDCLVYIKVITNKKNRYKISARDVTTKFVKFGAHVMSYDVHTIKEKEDILDKAETNDEPSMTPKNILTRVVNKTIKKVEDRKRIIKKGMNILEELND